MSDELTSADEIEALLELERRRWVESPAELFGALGDVIDGLLLDGARGAVAASDRVQNLEVKPNPGLVDTIAWAKSNPIHTSSIDRNRSS